MTELIAVVALAVVCVLWGMSQRQDESSCEGCSHPGSCSVPDAESKNAH